MIVKLLTEPHLEFLSLKGGCRGSSESTLVKMSNCWKSQTAAHIRVILNTLVDCILPTFDTVLYGESSILDFEGVGSSTTKSTLCCY